MDTTTPFKWRHFQDEELSCPLFAIDCPMYNMPGSDPSQILCTATSKYLKVSSNGSPIMGGISFRSRLRDELCEDMKPRICGDQDLELADRRRREYESHA